MSSTFHVAVISLDDVDVTDLCLEAAEEGHRMLERLVREWRDGVNRFDRPGELLIGAFVRDRVVAIGGLNQEPYEPAAGLGRLRHLYVLRAYRRQGVGTALVRLLLSHADGSFSAVRLRTHTEQADVFYRQVGFRPTTKSTATHEIQIGG